MYDFCIYGGSTFLQGEIISLGGKTPPPYKGSIAPMYAKIMYGLTIAINTCLNLTVIGLK